MILTSRGKRIAAIVLMLPLSTASLSAQEAEPRPGPGGGGPNIGGDLEFEFSAQGGIQWVGTIQQAVLEDVQRVDSDSFQSLNPVPISPVAGLSVYLSNSPFAGMEIEFQWTTFGYGRISNFQSAELFTEGATQQSYLKRFRRCDPLDFRGLLQTEGGGTIPGHQTRCTESFLSVFHMINMNIMARITDLPIPGLYLGIGVGIMGLIGGEISGRKYNRFEFYEYSIYRLRDAGWVQKDLCGEYINNPPVFGTPEYVAFDRDCEDYNWKAQHWGMLEDSERSKIDLSDHYDKINIPFILSIGWAPFIEPLHMSLKIEARFWFSLMSMEIGDAWRTNHFGFGIIGGITIGPFPDTNAEEKKEGEQNKPATGESSTGSSTQPGQSIQPAQKPGTGTPSTPGEGLRLQQAPEQGQGQGGINMPQNQGQSSNQPRLGAGNQF